MIAKIITGTNVSGLLHYLTNKKFEVLNANKLFPDANPNYITNEFREIQSLNPRCKNNVMHIVLSFPENDDLDDEKLKIITEDFLKKFGADDNQWISIKHFNTDHLHQHTAINRVKANGKLLSDSFSHLRARNICRSLEVKYNLNKISNFKNENISLNKESIKELIADALFKSSSIEEFIELMKMKNYKVLIGRGITFINLKNGAKIKGSAISRDYSLSNIKKQIHSPQPVQKLNKQLENEQNDITNIISSTISNLEFYDLLNSPNDEEYESEPKKKKKRRKKRKF